MKKSEVVDYIANKLERCHDRYGNLHDFHFVASEILEDLLDLGMLPPYFKPEHVPTEAIQFHKQFVKAHRWEHEEE